MNKVVIEINGVRHALVPDDTIWFDCDKCSLCDLCRKYDFLICNVADDSDCHFEIQKG